MHDSRNVKIKLTLPKDALDVIQDAIHLAGAGIIGNYSHCAIISEITGVFKPLEGSNPYLGNMNEITRTEEYLIEFLCKKEKVKQVIDEIKKVHPYEELALDIIPLLEI